MSEFSTLQAMGLSDIETISHYKLSQGANTEELKIYFKRPEASNLPNSSSFHFERNQVVGADTELGGSDPVLLAALKELNSLTRELNKGDRRALIMNEIDRLEQVMSSKIQELREDLARI